MKMARAVPRLKLGAGLWLALAAISCPAVHARSHAKPHKPRGIAYIQPDDLASDFSRAPSVAPAWTIPVGALGFAPPGALYMGERDSLASLDFIGEDRLLFTFRIPALLHRVPGGNGEEHEIRAVVLRLPAVRGQQGQAAAGAAHANESGSVEAGLVETQTNWLVHDYARYLWMLGGGHFLLRNLDTLSEGDATLKLRPLMRFPGPLLGVQLDPTQQLLLATSREPAGPGARSNSGAATDLDSNANVPGEDAASEPLVLRLLRFDSGRVMRATRERDPKYVPFNAEGYLDSLSGHGVDWTVEMHLFAGGSRSLGVVKSACRPRLTFISEREVLAAACADMGKNALVAMTAQGKTLWIDLVSDRQIWPTLTSSANGRRFARETLSADAPTDLIPLDSRNIKCQWLQVLDAATGRMVFESAVSPILDAGGNVALSPSGRRLAVLQGASIQVFELPSASPPAAQLRSH